MEVKMKLSEAVEMYKVIESLPKSDISVDVLTGIDLALIKKAIQPHYDGAVLADELSSEMKEYKKELKRTQREYNGTDELSEKIREINVKYRDAIEAEELKDEIFKKDIREKEVEIDAPIIDPSKLKGEGKTVASICCGLLPVLKVNE